MAPSEKEELQNLLNDILSRLKGKSLELQHYLSILYRTATAYKRIGPLQDAADLYQICLRTSQEKNTAHRIAFLSALNLSEIHARQAKWEVAQKYSSIAHRLLQHADEEDRFKYHTYLVLSMASQYIWAGRLEKAYMILNSTIEGFRSSEAPKSAVMGHLLSLYGTALSFLKYHKEAIRAYTEALQHLSPSPEPYALTLGNLALAYVEYGNQEMAYPHLEKALRYTKEYALNYAEGYIEMDWGFYWTAVKEYEKAIQAYNRAIEIFKENQDFYGLFFARKDLAVAIGKSGEKGKGERLLREVIGDCERYGLRFIQALALESLAELLRDPTPLEEAERLHRELGNLMHAEKVWKKREEMRT